MTASRKKGGAAKFDRITILTVVVFVLTGLAVFRLFDLQILKHNSYRARASGTYEFNTVIEPKRGEIFVQSKNNGLEINLKESIKSLFPSLNLYPVATNMELQLLYADPSLIQNPAEAAQKLSPILEMPEEDMADKLSKPNDSYEPLKHHLNSEQVKLIQDLKIAGLGFSPEINRFYPEGELFSHLLGFLGYKGEGRVGQYGIEEQFENILSGEPGMVKAEKDALGQWIAASERSVQPAVDGADIILTIDHAIQFNACTELKNALTDYEAEGGTIIILQPTTGKILALCNEPNFDSNNYSKVKDISLFINPAISHVYEPGSVFKIFTMATGLDTGKVTPTTTYEDKGVVKAGNYTIWNSDLKAHGIQTMTEVLEKSLNTGSIFVVQQIGSKIFKNYLEGFGFGKTTGVELKGEVAGNISSLEDKRDVYAYTASYGHGISATPLQIVAATGAIANGGKLMKPYLVDRIIKSDGTVVQTEPRVVRQVIRPSTAVTLGAMLVSVVKNGHSWRAGVDGYYVAGKTGTALIPDKTGGYSEETIHTFVGFAPVDDPKFVALIKLNKPKSDRFAENTSVKVFCALAKFMLNYYEIPTEY